MKSLQAAGRDPLQAGRRPVANAGLVPAGFLNGFAELADKTIMVQVASWRDHFKIDKTVLKAFWEDFSQTSPIRASELSEETAGDSIEFILWCLREGLFSEGDFTDFLSRSSNIPKVSSSFFESPVDHTFWSRVKDSHTWSPLCVPLGEWDGVLLVGSVTTEQTFKPSLNAKVVLATVTQLRELHSHLQETARIPTGSETPIIPTGSETPSVTEPASDSPPESDPFAALSKALGLENGSGESHNADELSSSEASEMPEGLVVPEGLVIPEGLILNTSTPEPSAPEASAPEASDEPAFQLGETDPPIALESDDPPSVVEAGSVVHNFETGEGEIVKKKPQVATLPPPAMPFAPIVTPEAPAMVKPPAPQTPKFELEPTEDKSAKPLELVRPPAEATVVVSAETAMDPVPPASSPTTRRPLFEPGGGPATISNPPPPRPASSVGGTQSGSQTGTGTATRARKLEVTPVTSFFIGGGPVSNPVNAKSALRSAPAAERFRAKIVSLNNLEPTHLDQCTTVDEAGAQALLQACNIFETAMILLFKDGTLQPWKWNDLFLSVNADKPNDIELTEPSIFKVVFRTAKPYHGYVVTSAVNQKFFNEFNRGQAPKHATIIPIMIDGRMGGMLLGFTNSKIDYRQSLRLMERLGFDLSRVFKMLRGGAAKAS